MFTHNGWDRFAVIFDINISKQKVNDNTNEMKFLGTKSNQNCHLFYLIYCLQF